MICLRTGAGKTYIAIMLIKHMSHQIRGEFFIDEQNKGAKRTVFLVPTVPLVEQQANAIRMHCDLKVGEYIGAMNVDSWDKEVWKYEFENHEVLVMTAEIFRVIIMQGFVSPSKVNLLVFDEVSPFQTKLAIN